MNEIEAYPLQWPAGYPRTEIPERHGGYRRNTTLEMERVGLMKELKLLGAHDIILSSNIPLRQDGFPYSGFERQKIKDRGMAVYFQLGKDKEYKVLACDAWDNWEHNVRALALTVQAMRALGRHKATQMLERAFTGFKALPERSELRANWWEVLQVSKNATIDQVERAFRSLAMKYHPDMPGTGDPEMFNKISMAREDAHLVLKQSS